MSSSNVVESSSGMLTTIIIMLVVACVAFALTSSMQKRLEEQTKIQSRTANQIEEQKTHKLHEERKEQQQLQQMEEERKRKEEQRREIDAIFVPQPQGLRRMPNEQTDNRERETQQQASREENLQSELQTKQQLPTPVKQPKKEEKDPAYDFTPLDTPLEQQLNPFLSSQYLLEEEASNDIEEDINSIENLLNGIHPSADGEIHIDENMDENAMKEKQKNVDKPSKAVQVLVKITEILDDKMNNILSKIPQNAQLAEERATQIALSFREGKTPVSETEYVTALSRLYDRRHWALLSYLLTVAPNDRYVAQWGKTINAKCVHEKSSRRALAIDLIYATLMLFDVDREIVNEDHLFAGRSLYYAPSYDAKFGTRVQIVAKILLYDLFRLLSYESEHILTHSSYDLEINHYMRYWQVRQIQAKYKHRLFSVFEQRCVKWYLSYIRSLCTSTLNNKFTKQFHIAAAQIIACHITEYPILYLDSERTLDKFSTKLWENTWRLMRDVEGRAYIMSYRVDLKAIMRGVDNSDLLRYQILNPRLQNRAALRKIVSVNRMSNQIVMYQKHFARYLVINKPNAPLPTYWDPLDTNTGRIYLGSGLSAIIRSFDEVECFIVKSKKGEVTTSKGLKDITEKERRIVICPFVYRRHAFEATNITESVTPLLRLKGAISIDTLTGYTTVGLQMQTVLERNYPMDPLRDYRGWMAYALNAFVRDNEFLLDFKRFCATRSFEYSTVLEIYKMRQLVEIGTSSYISYLSKLKTEENSKISTDKVNRRNYRVNLEKQNSTVQEPPAMLTSETYWYSGRQNSSEELIDFESLKWEDVREFGQFEQMLWSRVNVWNQEITEKLRFFFKIHAVFINENTICRFAAMLVILASSLKHYGTTKIGIAHTLKSIAQKLRKPDDLALLPREDLDICTCLPDKASMSGALCNLPTIAMIYERSYSQYVKANATLADERQELQHRAVFKVTFSVDDNLASITDDQQLFYPHVLPTDGRNFSKVLEPLFVPPFVITTTKPTNIDRVYNQQSELSCFNLLDTIDVSKTNPVANPLVLHVWRKQEKQWVNAVTLRVDCTADSEFKLFNVVWDSIQYLVVHQTSKVHCHDSAPGQVQAVSKLWYTVNHVADPTPERKVDLNVDAEAFDLLPTERGSKAVNSETAVRLGLDDKQIDNHIKLFYSSNTYDRNKSSWKIRLADRQISFPRHV